MCWNESASLTFTLMNLAAIIAVFAFNYKYKYGALFVFTAYGLMQFAQFLNWTAIHQKEKGYYLYSNFFDQETGEGNVCSEFNYYTTLFAWLLITVQPLFNNLAIKNFADVSLFSESRTSHGISIGIALSLVYFIGSNIQLYMGETGMSSNLMNDFSNSNSIASNVTCSLTGENHGYIFEGEGEGYLYWQFKLAHDTHLPNFLIYVLGCLFPILLCEKRSAQLFALIGNFGTYAFAKFMYPDTPEAIAFWCHASVFMVPLIMTHMLVNLYYRGYFAPGVESLKNVKGKAQ